MADNKKYYYMRLKENFFDTDEMVYLESLEEGFLFSNILLKLYLRSLKNEGVLMMNSIVPYDAKMISRFTNHSLSTVEKALFEFQKLGLIEKLDSGQMYMSNIELFVGKTTTEADRKRLGRKKAEQKLLPLEEEKEEDGQMSDKCPPERELEKEKEKDINTSSPKFSTFDIQASERLFELMLINNETAKKPNLEKWANDVRLMRERDNRTEEQIMYLIEWSQNDSFWKSNILSTGKLREKFDSLVVKVKSQKEAKQQTKTIDIKNNDYAAMDMMLNKFEGGFNSETSESTNNRILISENGSTF